MNDMSRLNANSVADKTAKCLAEKRRRCIEYQTSAQENVVTMRKLLSTKLRSSHVTLHNSMASWDQHYNMEMHNVRQKLTFSHLSLVHGIKTEN